MRVVQGLTCYEPARILCVYAGCEVDGQAKMKEKKFTISLIVRDEGTPTELWLRLDNVSLL